MRSGGTFPDVCEWDGFGLEKRWRDALTLIE